VTTPIHLCSLTHIEEHDMIDDEFLGLAYEISNDDWTPDPQQGSCSVTSWTALGNTQLTDRQILGEMAWADLIAQVEQQGGERLTYDLFETPGPDGTTTRYHAIGVEQP